VAGYGKQHGLFTFLKRNSLTFGVTTYHFHFAIKHLMQSCQTILATNVNSYSENHPEIGSVGHKKAHEC
jgi:hypothetical protein